MFLITAILVDVRCYLNCCCSTRVPFLPCVKATVASGLSAGSLEAEAWS